MTDIFVSYARSDHAFVSDLVGMLAERGGKEVWVDLERIPPTAEWLSEIFQAIESADNALFVLSPAFLDSEICAMELKHAQESGKRLIPLVRTDVDPASVQDPLRERNWLFWREQDNPDDAIERLLAAIELDLDWLKLHTRILVKANEWRRADNDKSRLLSGRALMEAESWRSGALGHDPHPTDIQNDFIDASRRRAIARRRTIVFISIFAATVAVVLTLWGLREQRRTARRSEAALARELIVKANAQPNHLPELRAHLAIEALRRLDALGESSHDAVKALRKARSFLLPAGETFHQSTPIKAIRFNSDGRYIGTLDEDGAVRLWSRVDRTKTGPFKSAQPIQSFAIDADGTAIGAYVAAFDDIEAHIYDLKRGREIAVLSHPGETLPPRSTVNIPLASVLSIALMNDAKRVITGGVSSVRVWSISGGSELLRAGGGAIATGPIVIGTDGTHASVQMLNLDRYVLSLESGKRIAGARERILAIGVGGDHLLRGEGANAKLNSRKDGLVSELNHGGQINAGAFSIDGRWVATGSDDGCAVLWHVSDGRPIASVSHDAPVSAVAFSPDTARIAIGGRNGRFQVRPVEDCREPLPLPHQSAIRSLAVSPDGKSVATGTEGGKIKVWDIMRGRLLAGFDQTHAVKKLAFSEDGGLLVTLDINATHLWHLRKKALDRSFEHLSDGSSGYKAIPWALNFSADGRYLAVGGSFNHTLLLDLKHRKIQYLKVTGSVLALRFLKNTGYLVAASATMVRVLDLARRETMEMFPNDHPIASMEISAEDRWMAVGDRQRNLTVWDIANRSVLFARQLAFVPTDLAFSHNSMHLAVKGDNTPIVIFRVPAGDVSFSVPRHGNEKIRAMAMNATGAYLASAGSDQIVRVWSLQTGNELERLAQGGRKTVLAFSLDGRYLFMGGTAWKAHRWLWERHDLIADTCNRLSNPSIARGKWIEFLGNTPYRETCPAF